MTCGPARAHLVTKKERQARLDKSGCERQDQERDDEWGKGVAAGDHAGTQAVGQSRSKTRGEKKYLGMAGMTRRMWAKASMAVPTHTFDSI